MGLFDSFGANRGSIFGRLDAQQGQALGSAIGQDPSLGAIPFQGRFVGPVRRAKPVGFEQQFQEQQFDTGQANRAQMLQLLGLTGLGGSGGLLGQNFFQNILTGTPGGLVGDVAGAAAPLTSGITGPPRLGSPGFADSPTSPGAPGGSPGGVPAAGGDLFSQIIAGRQALGGDILGDLSRFGGSERARIDRDFSNVLGSQVANLEARGLGGSNLTSAVARGVERDRQGERGALEDRLIQQRVNAKQQIGEGLFGDVNTELQRQLARRGQGFDLLSSIFGSALGVI